MARPPLTLRTHLVLLVLAAVVPGALLTYLLVSRSLAQNRAVIERRLLDAARVDAASLDREFEGSIRALQVLATSPALDADDFEAFYHEARRVQSVQRDWYTVILVSLDGDQLVNSVRPWGEPLIEVAERESLDELIASPRPVVGRLRRDPRGGEQLRFPIRVPVMRAGSLKYALTVVLEPGSLTHLVRSQLPAAEEWTRTILDPEGTIAVRTRDAERFVGRRTSSEEFAVLSVEPGGVIRQRAIDGTEIYAAVGRSLYGWTTAVAVPLSVLDAPMRGSGVGLLAGATILLLTGVAGVLVISRRFSHDFRAAADSAQALAEGRAIGRIDPRVTETRRLHESLRTAASLLEQRQRERDEEVRRADEARAEAEAANRMKDRFLAVLGHELRNPLAPALTALEVMKMRDPSAFQREREVLERQIAHMVRLVNDLLDVARLTQGKVELHRRRFELWEAVDRAADMAHPLIQRRRHELRIEVAAAGLLLDADDDRVVQILTNLLTNAARYTPEGGHIRLKARVSGRAVQVVCEDDGPGIPPDLMPTLFEPFAQGPRSAERQEGGLGLGLALAATLARLHGGTIRAENRLPERGSRFTLELPAATGLLRVRQPDGPEPFPRPGLRVLIVDDNADAREMLSHALAQAGHAVQVAAGGAEAITAAAAWAPDVAILDIGLPGMNGYEVAQILRRDHPHIRLIALTGFGQPADREAALRAGFDVHCVKPVALEALLGQVGQQQEPRSELESGA